MFKQVKLVAGQVYRTKTKTPGFWLIVLSPLLLPIIGFLIGFMMSKGESNKPTRLAIVDNSALVKTIKSEKLLDVSLSEVTTADIAKKKLKDDKIYVYLVADRKSTRLNSSHQKISY